MNGVCCDTFREAAEKRGLLHSDSNLIDCMSEAVSYQTPYRLRLLFFTLLVHCCPTNPKDLWEKFEDSMSEDFKILPNLPAKDIRHKVLSHINEILHSMGHNVNEYKLISEIIQTSREAKEAREVHFERTITVSDTDILLEKRLNVEQRRACNVIIGRIFSNRRRAFFIDGPGGTGKTFLYLALLATVRSKGFIVLATTSSGVAASILPEGRTAHSRFKIPIDIDQNFSINISKQMSLAYLIRYAKLIIWDEVSMVKSKMIEVFSLLLKDIMDSHALFGGKVIVFGGDFRQTLHVVRNEKKKDFICESLLYCNIWNRLEKLQLSEKIRTKTDPAFCKYLMRIGNGTEKVNCDNKIKIPDSIVIPFTSEEESLDELFKITYPNVSTFFSDSSSVTSHVILTTKNDFVDELNDMLIAKFSFTSKTYVAIDETVECADQSLIETDPEGVLEGFAEVVRMEPEKAEW
nr:PREDICTED: uncharacterized protein LOC107811256 [Nicotiana tabacum]